MRLTKNRKIILDIFENSKKPLSAEKIQELLIDYTIDLSTIYRTIDYFYNNDLLLRFHFDNKSYYFLDTKDHYHYFLCTKCLDMHKIDCNLKDTINTLVVDRGFQVNNHEINIYGLCDKCK